MIAKGKYKGLSPSISDYNLWTAQLADLLKTDDPALLLRLLFQGAHCGWQMERDHALNLIIAAVAGIGPRDQLEALLALQMVSVHNVAMELLRRTMLSEQSMDGVTVGVQRATALLRTFTAQMETLVRYRGGGKQTVTVQHVQVDAGGQAIVGNVHHSPKPTGGGGMKRQSEEQPHEPGCTPFAGMPPCEAKTRTGTACRRVAGPKGRCRLHGGAPGSGAPKGNRNRMTHGRYSAAALAERKAIRAVLKQSKAHLQMMRQERSD